MNEFFKNLLGGHNQFVISRLLLMTVGGLGVSLRAVPMALWEWCVRQVTMVITVKDDDAAFVWVKEWFLEQDFAKRIRHVDLDSTLRGETLALMPAPSLHWFWHSGRPFTVMFYRSEETKLHPPKRIESFRFTTIGRNPEFLQEFVAEIAACHQRSLGIQSSLYLYDEYWSRVMGYVPRLLESVILASGEKERLMQDVKKFRASKQRYHELGVPYYRGYLFYGPPGTGKTSLASAIAQAFGMSIYAINLIHFTDRGLMNAINEVPPNSVILFEDIDCMSSSKATGHSSQWTEFAGETSAQRQEGVGPGVTLSGLLNVLDGFNAPENVLFIMTTNKAGALDPALLRPGRIDYKLYLGEATEEQKVELFRRFFFLASEAEALRFVKAHSAATTMAEFQGLLLALERDGNEENLAAPSPTAEKIYRQYLEEIKDEGLI